MKTLKRLLMQAKSEVTPELNTRLWAIKYEVDEAIESTNEVEKAEGITKRAAAIQECARYEPKAIEEYSALLAQLKQADEFIKSIKERTSELEKFLTVNIELVGVPKYSLKHAQGTVTTRSTSFISLSDKTKFVRTIAAYAPEFGIAPQEVHEYIYPICEHVASFFTARPMVAAIKEFTELQNMDSADTAEFYQSAGINTGERTTVVFKPN